MPLAGLRILVPPTRVDVHPLAGMLARRGADVVELPRIAPGPPASFDAIDAALRDRGRFDWIVFVGSESANRFLDREPGAGDGIRARLVALGAGTRKALQRRGIEVDHAPQRHVGADVADVMGDVAGRDVLLVRREGASRDLPRILAERGARVVEADGYAMAVATPPEDREALLAAPLDAIAFGNPTAARFLAEGLAAWDLRPEAFSGAWVAAAGAVTARTAREAGFAPAITVEGRMIDFARAIERGQA